MGPSPSQVRRDCQGLSRTGTKITYGFKDACHRITNSGGRRACVQHCGRGSLRTVCRPVLLLRAGRVKFSKLPSDTIVVVSDDSRACEHETTRRHAGPTYFDEVNVLQIARNVVIVWGQLVLQTLNARTLSDPGRPARMLAFH